MIHISINTEMQKEFEGIWREHQPHPLWREGKGNENLRKRE